MLVEIWSYAERECTLRLIVRQQRSCKRLSLLENGILTTATAAASACGVEEEEEHRCEEEDKVERKRRQERRALGAIRKFSANEDTDQVDFERHHVVADKIHERRPARAVASDRSECHRFACRQQRESHL